MCKVCIQRNRNVWDDYIAPCPRLERAEKVLYWINLATVTFGGLACLVLAFLNR